MRTYVRLVVGALRALIILAMALLAFIHWSWWAEGVPFPDYWWMFDLAFAAVLSLLWGVTAFILDQVRKS